ncbi:hypothetical protein B9479_007424 [Cryptococcus floricola]|uniref:Uncharacterized protein n=1 Tax=Cryptococcus floricola TaxID=2591691 RepID=A0A5D3ANR8_9TREE|nr:hypothetical protein B9479_007424 [Cryptococcus floricola]
MSSSWSLPSKTPGRQVYPDSALHKHRHVSHSIPLPGDAVDTVSAAAAAGGDGDISMSEAPPTAETGGRSAILPENVKALLSGLQDQKDQKEEWFHWRYTDEQEARRKSFLPLA